MRRAIVTWGGPAASALLLYGIHTIHEAAERLEEKVVYQRRLINNLRGDVLEMRGEWRASIDHVREDIRDASERSEAHQHQPPKGH